MNVAQTVNSELIWETFFFTATVFHGEIAQAVSCFQGCFLNSSVYYNKPVKLPRTLMHYGKDCTWVWSRVLISHSAAPRAILASRPHPHTIISVMHSHGNLTSIYAAVHI